MTLESREPQVGPICCRALRALFCPSRLRSRLQAFCFRELPGGPVTASTSRSVLLFWHWCLGSRRPALFAADLCGRKLFCPLCFRSRLSALRFQEMPGGPVAAIPWRQELLLGAGVSEAAGRPCLLQASSFWVPSIGPYSCTWDVCCSQCLRSLLQALCFRVLSGGPVAVLFPRASGAACRPCSRCLRRCLPALCFWVPSGGPVAAGPSVLGAVCRPIQLYLETCMVLFTVLQGCRQLQVYRAVWPSLCLLVVAFTPKACVSVESQTRPLLA